MWITRHWLLAPIHCHAVIPDDAIWKELRLLELLAPERYVIRYIACVIILDKLPHWQMDAIHDMICHAMLEVLALLSL
jgi:hypothetical protein